MNSENKVSKYLKGVKQEWSKVTWPERVQVVSETVWVLAIVILFTLIVLIYDWAFDGIFKIFQ